MQLLLAPRQVQRTTTVPTPIVIPFWHLVVCVEKTKLLEVETVVSLAQLLLPVQVLLCFLWIALVTQNQSREILLLVSHALLESKPSVDSPQPVFRWMIAPMEHSLLLPLMEPAMISKQHSLMLQLSEGLQLKLACQHLNWEFQRMLLTTVWDLHQVQALVPQLWALVWALVWAWVTCLDKRIHLAASKVSRLKSSSPTAMVTLLREPSRTELSQLTTSLFVKTKSKKWVLSILMGPALPQRETCKQPHPPLQVSLWHQLLTITQTLPQLFSWSINSSLPSLLQQAL